MCLKKRVMLRLILGLSLFLVGVFLFWFLRAAVYFDPDREVSIEENVYYPVVYVVDGDTFKTRVAGKTITVRLLGVNTPETVDPRRNVECYGPEASQAVKGLISGQKVLMKLNPQRERRDKYGRYLAYVYLENGLFLNEYVLQEGLAREYTYGRPYTFQAEFRAIEAEAQAGQKGLWGSCKESK